MLDIEHGYNHNLIFNTDSFHEPYGFLPNVCDQERQSSTSLKFCREMSFHFLESTGKMLVQLDTSGVAPGIRTAMYVWGIFIATVGAGGNFMIIISIYLNKKLRQYPNIYVGSLALADFLVCTMIMPYTTSIYKATSLDSRICEFMAGACITMLASSWMNMSAVAINRYVLLVRGKETYDRLFTQKTVVMSLAFIWSYPILLLIPPMFGFGLFEFNPPMGICTFKAQHADTYIYANIFLGLICYAPCLTACIYCYVKIFDWLKQHRQRLHKKFSSRVHPSAYGLQHLSPRALEQLERLTSPNKKSNAMHHDSTAAHTLTTSSPTKALDKHKTQNKSLAPTVTDADPPHTVTTCNSLTVDASSAAETRTSGESSGVDDTLSKTCQSFIISQLANLCIYIITWVPLFCLTGFDFETKMPWWLYHLAVGLPAVNYITNFLLLGYHVKEFQRTFKVILTCNWPEYLKVACKPEPAFSKSDGPQSATTVPLQ